MTACYIRSGRLSEHDPFELILELSPAQETIHTGYKTLASVHIVDNRTTVHTPQLGYFDTYILACIMIYS